MMPLTLPIRTLLDLPEFSTEVQERSSVFPKFNRSVQACLNGKQVQLLKIPTLSKITVFFKVWIKPSRLHSTTNTRPLFAALLLLMNSRIPSFLLGYNLDRELTVMMSEETRLFYSKTFFLCLFLKNNFYCLRCC